MYLCIFVHGGINMLEPPSIILAVTGHRDAEANPRLLKERDGVHSGQVALLSQDTEMNSHLWAI